MGKIEYHAVIKFLTKVGKNAKEIHDRLVAVYNDTASSYATVTRWHKEFRHGRESLEDDSRVGRTFEATSEDTVDRVEAMIMENRRVKVEEISLEIRISHGSVCTIINHHLGMSKVSARWVPRNLSLHDRLQGQTSSEELLTLYNAYPAGFKSRVMTGDETWVHHWDPETKLESMAWKQKGSPTPLKFWTQPLAGKIMATIFWDAGGVLLVDVLPRGSTITGKYYAGVLGRLRDSIRQKRRGKLTRGVLLLLHDNAPVHKAHHAQAALRDCGFEQFNHPSYSPDLAPNDYFLFRQLKSSLRGRRFDDNDEVKEAVMMWLEEQLESFWLAGIQSPSRQVVQMYSIKGNYIEK
uniref:Transposase n=1 Tax=Bythograea thermydron TaxID=118381 RepID=Q5QT23_BYTTH|nr:transposase [Bythograea thermydron]